VIRYISAGCGDASGEEAYHRASSRRGSEGRPHDHRKKVPEGGHVGVRINFFFEESIKGSCQGGEGRLEDRYQRLRKSCILSTATNSNNPVGGPGKKELYGDQRSRRGKVGVVKNLGSRPQVSPRRGRRTVFYDWKRDLRGGDGGYVRRGGGGGSQSQRGPRS